MHGENWIWIDGVSRRTAVAASRAARRESASLPAHPQDHRGHADGNLCGRQACTHTPQKNCCGNESISLFQPM